MKCLLCIHYDVVNLQCQHLAEKSGLEEPVSVPIDWWCGDYESATAKNLNDKLTVDITIKI